MERKLASIQVISEIKPHPNADRLEIARVLGWDVVIAKDEGFKVGEKVVYFEIDSCLPVGVPEYEFLRKNSYKNSPILGEVFRLKTIRLRGVVSQGLILPLEICFKDCMPINGPDGFEIGEDVTEMLNIKKWEEPETAKLGGDAVGKRPSWIIKSDETRIQSVPEILDEFGDKDYYISLKYDGSSFFIALDENDEFHFGSHNLELKPIERPGSFYNYILENHLQEKLLAVKNRLNASKIYVIGELVAPGIQRNPLKLLKMQWIPFTVGVDGKRLGLYDMQAVVEDLGLKMVEVEEIGKNLKSVYPTIESLLERAGEDRKHIYPGECEGIVIRPVQPTFSEVLGTDLSFKVINNKYLLKEEK